MSVNVIEGDMLLELPKLAAAGVRFDSVVTDAPYHLSSIFKRFGGENAAPAKGGEKYARISRGFMGKEWDGGDIAFRAETWAAVGAVMKPGAHLVAFGGTKGWHRMACAIEAAGFEIRDTIAWLYGSGLPKSHNIGKAIDKAAGRPLEIAPKGAPVKRMIPGADQHKVGWEKNNGREYQPGEHVPSDESAPWAGWGTALKPAFEPIVLARWPMSEKTVAANVLKHGTAALNVDACRIDGEQWEKSGLLAGGESVNDYGDGLNNAGRSGSNPLGRWPANVAHDGSDDVVGAFPDTGGAQGIVTGKEPSTSTMNNLGLYGQRATSHPRGDAGSAARFFYSSKADAGDRLESKHPTVKPVDLMRWLVRLVTPRRGLVLDPFAGSGTTGMACMAEGFDCTLIEREAEYAADIRRRIAHVYGGDAPLFSTEGKR